MMRPLLMVPCAVLGLSLGCGPGDYTPDPGVQTDDAEAVDLDNLRIGVSGTVDLLPEARRLLEARGLPLPTLEGAPLTAAEPLRLAVNDANATFGTAPAAADGAFTVRDVAVREMHLSLAVGAQAAGLVPAHTVVYDAAFTGARPRTDIIGAHVWALPDAFHDALSVAVGRAPSGATPTTGRPPCAMPASCWGAWWMPAAILSLARRSPPTARRWPVASTTPPPTSRE